MIRLDWTKARILASLFSPHRTIENSSMPLGIRPTVDFVFKLLFGSLENADLLIHLLNAVLQAESPIQEVEILNPFNEKMFEDD